MPLFEFECRQCGTRFEELVRSGTTPRCPQCSAEDLDRMLSVFAVKTRSTQASRTAAGPCGSCGDPRGPGACSLN